MISRLRYFGELLLAAIAVALLLAILQRGAP